MLELFYMVVSSIGGWMYQALALFLSMPPQIILIIVVPTVLIFFSQFVSLGEWSSSSKVFFVWDRVYKSNGKPSMWVWPRKRYSSWFGYWGYATWWHILILKKTDPIDVELPEEIEWDRE